MRQHRLQGMVENLGVHRAQQKAPDRGAALGAQHDQVVIAFVGEVQDLVGRVAHGHQGLTGHFAPQADLAGLENLLHGLFRLGFDGLFHVLSGGEGGISSFPPRSL